MYQACVQRCKQSHQQTHLFGVEDFQHCSGRVSLKIARSDLVYLIQEEDRVGYPDLSQPLNNQTRHRGDVRPAMSSYFCFVSYCNIFN